MSELQLLINRDDLPSNKNRIFCDTTFEMGDFYVKVIIFRHTEFEKSSRDSSHIHDSNGKD
jgi:hypothetical protein